MDSRPLAEYTYPGVVKYLQQEFTRNERDRIQWNSERQDMKLAIVRLTSENLALKETNQRLEKELASLGGGSKLTNKGTTPTDSTETSHPEPTPLNIEPLKNAREHLKSRMNEIVTMLRGTDLDVVNILELKKERGVLAVSDRRKRAELEKGKNVESPGSADFPITPEPDSPGAFYKKPVTPDVIIDDHSNVEPVDPTGEETDSETVIGDDEILDSRTGLAKGTDGPIFALSAHSSTVISISALHDQLLTASKEGDINQWKLPELVSDPENARPMKSFFDTTTPKFMSWIDETTFVTASPYEIKLWDSSKSTEAPTVHFKVSKEIKDIQTTPNQIVTLDSTGIMVYELKNMSAKPAAIPLKGTSMVQCFTILNNTVFGLHTNSIDEYDIQTKTKTKAHALEIPLSTPPTKITALDTTLTIVSSSQCILYDLTTESSWPIETAGPAFINCELTDNQYVAFYANGDVKVYDRKGDKVEKEFNHYCEVISSKLSGLVPPGIGKLYQKKYAITTGDDMIVRGWLV
ncbi:CYFA0S17e00210g1_1 [Cyberlindnera fabianii]|uniref:CYFA0S17e00210g1_1 n=1 Tax=Cyberlindnera fabianii TaxID=36022 RepID=A0A061B5I4_CYBFA|nr:CYFA0S17e00210g1_1 [Cyberlindnera fabianii]